MTKTIALLLTAFVSIQLASGNKILINCDHLKFIRVDTRGEIYIGYGEYVNQVNIYTYPDLVKLIEEQCHD